MKCVQLFASRWELQLPSEAKPVMCYFDKMAQSDI